MPIITDPPFVGRDAALGSLLAALADAAGGRGGVVRVTGDAGIGKTRLLDEFVMVARPTGAVVLLGRCLDGDVGPPFPPFTEAVGAWVDRVGPERAAAEIGWAAPVLAPIIPSLLAATDSDVLSLDPEEERARLFEAVTQVLVAASRAGPVLLVLDDLHLAGPGTAALTRYLARATSGMRVLIVVVYRTTELDRRHPLRDALADMAEASHAGKLDLGGLDEHATKNLINATFGGQVDDAVAADIARRSQGNPLFARELALDRIGRGDPRPRTGDPADGDVPVGVRVLVGRRVGRLSEAAQMLLAVASITDTPFRFGIAAEVAGLDEGMALDALDEAIAAGVLVESVSDDSADEYEFAHALVRDSLREQLSLSRRLRIERGFADALVRVAGGRPGSRYDGEIAERFHRSRELPGASEGADFALVAAGSAMAARSFDRSATLLEKALDLVPGDDARRPRILARLASALAYSVRPSAATGIAAEAAEALAASESDGAAAELLADVSKALGDLGHDTAAWSLARLGLSYVADRRDSTWAWLVALDATRQAAEGDLGAAWLPDDVLESMRHVLEVEPHPKRSYVFVPYPSRAAARENRGDDPITLAFLVGDYKTAYALARPRAENAAVDGRLGAAVFWWSLESRTATALGMLDDASAALASARDCAARMATPAAFGMDVEAARDELNLARDDGWEDAARDVSLLLETEPVEARWALAAIAAAGARVLARLGRADDAIRLVERTLPAIERLPGYARNYVRIVCDAATALWWAGRTDHSEVIERNLREKVIGPDFRSMMMDGRLALARLCAITGRGDEAARWFADARRVLDEQGARPLRAIGDLDEAMAIVRWSGSGDPAAAVMLASRARDEFLRIGMPGWVRQADVLLHGL